MHAAQENSDIRLLIGAFEKDKMLGVTIGSFAEPDDIPIKEIELNGFCVYPNQRSRGISLKMLKYILDFYVTKGMKKIVI